MGFFVAVALVGLAAINMGFGQGQQNPKASNFFESDPKIKHEQHFIVDERA